VDEYRVFVSGVDEENEEFETHREKVPVEINSHLTQVTRVARLREVRAVTGFTRINPPFDQEESEIAPLSVTNLDWLPAIEVRGEGIFIRLDQNRLLNWESSTVVTNRVAKADNNWSIEWEKRNPGKPRPFPASPRLLLLHSLAHALIRQLTLECGYSSASLRERLYVSEGEAGMAGILIYTATPDSDGTLGGLQRRAMPDLLGPTVIGALRSARWCSSDPLCITGELAALDSHSIASCHSCMLAPETSCELHNRFLDRGLLIGNDGYPGLGFFEDIIL